MASHHLTRALLIPLVLALTTTAWAGTRSASMTVGVIVVGSCSVSTDPIGTTGSPGVACSTSTVEPIVEQRTVQTSEASDTPGSARSTTTLTVVTY